MEIPQYLSKYRSLLSPRIIHTWKTKYKDFRFNHSWNSVQVPCTHPKFFPFVLFTKTKGQWGSKYYQKSMTIRKLHLVLVRNKKFCGRLKLQKVLESLVSSFPKPKRFYGGKYGQRQADAEEGIRNPVRKDQSWPKKSPGKKVPRVSTTPVSNKSRGSFCSPVRKVGK